MNKTRENKFQLYDIKNDTILDYTEIGVANLLTIGTNNEYIRKNFTGYSDCLGNEVYNGDIIFNPTAGIELLSYVTYDSNYDEYLEVTTLHDGDTYEKLNVFIDNAYVVGNIIQNNYNELQKLNLANFIQDEDADIIANKNKFRLYDHTYKEIIEYDDAKKLTVSAMHSKRYCKLSSTGEIDSNGFEIYDSAILYDINNCGLYSYIHYNKEICSYEAISVVNNHMLVTPIERIKDGHIVGDTISIDYGELVKINDYKQTLNLSQALSN